MNVMIMSKILEVSANCLLSLINEDELIAEIKEKIEDLTNFDFDETEIDEKIEKIVKGFFDNKEIKKKESKDFVCIKNLIVDVSKIEMINKTENCNNFDGKKNYNLEIDTKDSSGSVFELEKKKADKIFNELKKILGVREI